MCDIKETLQRCVASNKIEVSFSSFLGTKNNFFRLKIFNVQFLMPFLLGGSATGWDGLCYRRGWQTHKSLRWAEQPPPKISRANSPEGCHNTQARAKGILVTSIEQEIILQFIFNAVLIRLFCTRSNNNMKLLKKPSEIEVWNHLLSCQAHQNHCLE